MSKILLNDFNNIYPLEKDLPQNKLNEQDIVRTLAFFDFFAIVLFPQV
jgi:hypothetical protein